LNKIKLFTTGTENNKTMWYWDSNPICNVCDKSINDYDAGFIVDWDKLKGRIDNLIHLSCLSKYVKSPHSITQSRWNVLLTDIVPPKSTPVFINNPSFKPTNNNISVFDTEKINSDQTTDNAWRSKSYPSLEGATIGKQNILEEIDMREKEIEKKLLS